jgi:hypothetical protein
VYRDKRGRKLDMLDEYMASQERADSRAAAQHELRYEWGTGAADKARAKTMADELRDAAERPFSVFADDAKLNEELKQCQRVDDPMAAYMAGKAAPAQPEPAGGRRCKPLYSGPPPERQPLRHHAGLPVGRFFPLHGAEKRLAQASSATGELSGTTSTGFPALTCEGRGRPGIGYGVEREAAARRCNAERARSAPRCAALRCAAFDYFVGQQPI